MSMLIEKRQELVSKLNSLEAARQAEIESRVAEHRKIVEAQVSTEQIDKVKNVIKALDEVISYESSATCVVSSSEPSPRPGMAAVFTPERN